MNYKFIFTSLLLFLQFCAFSQQDELKTYLDSAASYRLTGDTMEVYYLSKAIALQPSNPKLYEARAYAKSFINIPNNNKYGSAAAIRDLDVAIRLSRKTAFYYEQRGYQRYLLKDFQKALKDFNKAIRYDKKKASAYRKRGDVYWEFKNYPRAGNDFYTASELDTTSVYNLRKVGDCLYEIGNFRTAIDYYNKAIKKAENKSNISEEYNEDYLLALLYRANSKGYINASKEAIKDYSQVIEYNEKFQGLLDYTIEAYLFRGMAYLNLDKKQQGCEDLKKAVSLGSIEAQDYFETYCKE